MKLAIAFIAYNQSSFQYLPFFLPSLFRSIEFFKGKTEFDLNISILAFDNSDSSNRDNYNYLKHSFSEKGIDSKIWESKENLGFSRAYNIMFNFAIENDFDYFLMLNPDVLLKDDFLLELIDSSKKYLDFSVLAPCILYWDFVNNKKTDIIDSCGIGITKFNFFFDRGQGSKFEEKDYPAEEVFGFTGAGALLNLKKLSLLAYQKNNYLEFFDEEMFMYKEDVEFSYRLQLAGLKIFFIPQAIMYHHRSLSSRRNKILSLFFRKKNYKSRSRSLQNQLLIMYRIRKLPFSSKIRLFTAGRLFLLFIYSLFFRRRALLNFIKIKKQIEVKPPYLKGNIEGTLRIEKFMNTS